MKILNQSNNQSCRNLCQLVPRHLRQTLKTFWFAKLKSILLSGYQKHIKDMRLIAFIGDSGNFTFLHGHGPRQTSIIHEAKVVSAEDANR